MVCVVLHLKNAFHYKNSSFFVLYTMFICIAKKLSAQINYSPCDSVFTPLYYFQKMTIEFRSQIVVPS